MSDLRTVTVAESRFIELMEKAVQLDAILAKHPELKDGQKLTSAAKRYKSAFEAFVKRVDQVLSSKEIVGVFQIAAVHGFEYKGDSLAKDIAEARKLLG